ncbi:MAG: C25 family cysteine peptidase, partial [Candidatus Fermentibacteria bacterium]|nr:C25 family cysteine peptidase [Candidatus Fermentibacteria bacterium]
MSKLIFLMIFVPVFICYGQADIEFRCSSDLESVSVDTVFHQGTEYHQISISGFSALHGVESTAGFPSVPAAFSTFLLPPHTQIDSILITEAEWVLLPGKFYLYPFQSGLMSDPSFTSPDSSIYNSALPFPERPVEIAKQGSSMGYSVVSLTGSPIKYIPADSAVYILTSITLDFVTGPSEFQQITPNRETRWSSSLRNRGILGLVPNPGNMDLYQQPLRVSFADRVSALTVTQAPSSEGDGVDMIIITNDELAENFQQFADYRTQQGIVTVVRTVEWIDQFYSGCDTQERMRNFIRDAHTEWGIQAVLLGGDDCVVPIRESNGWAYNPGPFPSYMLPVDDYYSDIDGDWTYDGTNWRVDPSVGYIDLCLGRWPVNTADDVDLFFNKIRCYEQPDIFPENFARRILLLGSNNPAGNGADHMIDLISQLTESSAIPDHLDPPSTLYFPHSLPGGDLCRINALEEFDQGYNLIIHADHSEVHKLATAGNGTLGQYMWDSDFSTMDNSGKPSILWTLGCETGHFDGAFSFAEAGLLASTNTGLVAVMANARGGLHSQKITAYAFCDALFNTGWIASMYESQSLHWPLSFLGEAYRSSKNSTVLSFFHLNLLGSPLMYVWRDDPASLSLSVPPILLREGVSVNLPVTVTDGVNPVEGATVCLWKKDEIFSLLETNASGHVVFTDVCIADGNDELVITAVKRRREINSVETTTVDYLPDRIIMDVLPGDIPIISLNGFSVDPQGDGNANPGETVDIILTAVNSGEETGTEVSVELSVVSGSEYIDAILNSQSEFSDISAGDSAESTDPLVLVINSGVSDYSTIEFNLTFTYSSSAGTLQWNSPLFLTIYSESYALTVMDPSADNSNRRTAEIDISDMLLANCGLGTGKNLNITISNLSPAEPFQVNALSHQEIESNTASSLEGQLNLTVMPTEPHSSWLDPEFPRCFMDITVTSDGGSFTARNISVEMIAELQNQEVTPPENLIAYETGEDFVSLVWEHTGNVNAAGYYIYCDDGVTDNRVYPVPVQVKQVTVEGLLPGREYTFGVTSVDLIGRESEPALLSANTGCPVVQGWPLYLDGSPGGGAAIADIDNDGYDEIIVATSFGVVYLIERDGTFEKLYPPPGYDYDRFLGCAAGDVDGDSQLEIVVSSQRKIEVLDQEQVSVLLFDRFGGLWGSQEIAYSDVNEEASSPNIAGTPVLFQGDSGSSLEIALRTRGNNGGTPHLYVWRYDASSDTWVDFSTNFPVMATGGFYNSPSAVDFDQDGFQELVLPVMGSGGAGSALMIVDFQPESNAEITSHNLHELDTSGKLAWTFGTVATASQYGSYFVAGVAKEAAMSGSFKKLWVAGIESDPEISVSVQWQTEWLTGLDSYGNMPGPSIGNVDADPGLEVLYTLNDGLYGVEGYLGAWDLASGGMDFQSDYIPYNPILAGGGSSIRSQPVSGATTMQGSDDMAIFCGFSSFCSGFDPYTSSAIIDGFPTGMRDGAWAAPSVCDLDADGAAEVLYIDYSGLATLFNWQQGSYTTEGWHMYQDNPHRSGYYNNDSTRESLDIAISDLQTHAPLDNSTHRSVTVVV